MMKKVKSSAVIPPEYKKGIIASCVMTAVIAVCIVLTLFAVRWKKETAQPEVESSVKWHWVTADKVPEGAEILETGEQYRFSKKEFRKNQMMSVLDGWELYNINKVWSDEIETTSDSFIEEAPPGTLQYRTEVRYEDVKITQYNYKRYHYTENGEDVFTYTGAHGGGEWEYLVLAYELGKGGLYDGRQTRVDEEGGIWFKAGVNSESELTENKTVTVVSSPYTVYYFKRATYSYDFFRWGGFSSWSFNRPADSDDVQVETRKVYKIRG